MPISVLIGADLYAELILDDTRKGKIGQPIAQNLQLGWVISESTDTVTSHLTRAYLTQRYDNYYLSKLSKPFQPDERRIIHAHHSLNELGLESEIRRFWEIEEILQSVPLIDQEKQCETHFHLTHTRESNGRYVVRLPFKQGPPIDIGASRVCAEHLLTAQLRRLQKNQSWLQSIANS